MRDDPKTPLEPTATPFDARLMPGERILWHGQPERGLFLTGTDYFNIGYGLIFAYLGTRIVGLMGDQASHYSPVVGLVGTFFIIAGLFPLVGRIVVDAWLRRCLFYAVTDKRVLIDRRAGLFSKFASLSLNALPNVHLRGSVAKGNLRFGLPTPFFARRFMYLANAIPSLDPVPQFLNIAEPDKVLDTITRAAEGKA